MNLCTSTRELEWKPLETEEDCLSWGVDPMGSIGLVAVRDPQMPEKPVQAIITPEQFAIDYNLV